MVDSRRPYNFLLVLCLFLCLLLSGPSSRRLADRQPATRQLGLGGGALAGRRGAGEQQGRANSDTGSFAANRSCGTPSHLQRGMKPTGMTWMPDNL